KHRHQRARKEEENQPRHKPTDQAVDDEAINADGQIGLPQSVLQLVEDLKADQRSVEERHSAQQFVFQQLHLALAGAASLLHQLLQSFVNALAVRIRVATDEEVERDDQKDRRN